MRQSLDSVRRVIASQGRGSIHSQVGTAQEAVPRQTYISPNFQAIANPRSTIGDVRFIRGTRHRSRASSHEGGLPPTATASASAIVTAVAQVGSMEDDPFRLSLLLWLSLEMDLGTPRTWQKERGRELKDSVGGKKAKGL